MEVKSIPNHVLCARALCNIRDDGFLPIQILNGSQQTVILHKGTKIASFYPIQNVCVVEDKTSVNTATESLNVVDFSDVDMGGSELTESQRGELMSHFFQKVMMGLWVAPLLLNMAS